MVTVTPLHSVGATLTSGRSLLPEQSLLADNGPSRVTMQTDGNLVLYYVPTRQPVPSMTGISEPKPNCRTRNCLMTADRALWSTRTQGHRGAVATLLASGDLVVRQGSHVLWASRTGGHRGDRLVLGAGGNLGLFPAVTTAPAASATATLTAFTRTTASHGTEKSATLVSAVPDSLPLWSTGTSTPLYIGSSIQSTNSTPAMLGPNQFLESPNGLYELYMMPTGELVVWVLGTGPCPMMVMPKINYKNSTETGPFGFTFTNKPIAGSSLVLAVNGALSLTPPGGNLTPPGWTTPPSYGTWGATLTMQSVGNLVTAVTNGGGVIWASGTNTQRGFALCPGETIAAPQILTSVDYTPVASGTGNGYSLAFASYKSGQELDSVSARAITTQVWKQNDIPSGEFLTQQTDGNLVVYPAGGGASGTAYWATGTNNHPGAWAFQQGVQEISPDGTSGNLFVISAISYAAGSVSYQMLWTDAKGYTMNQTITLPIQTSLVALWQSLLPGA